jgi:cellulose synthase/poly-beta-1,6-N-acetylglucosamine synthase-like glycosyltransferase
MISFLAAIFLITTGVFLAAHVFWAWKFAFKYPPKAFSLPQGQSLPRAAVLLSIRGADPSLWKCLQGLVDQNYPDYDIHIVIDSPEDPAWGIISHFLDRANGPRIHPRLLEERKDTCSLKMSALVQAIRAMDESYQVVVLIDADVVPYPDWLRDLTVPLADPKVGATTGVRWFAPSGKRLGSMVRLAWNAGASSQMSFFHIPWGGSLAFRAEVLRGSDLLPLWSQSFGEDTSTWRVLRALGLTLHHVPAATMVNRETIGLRSCFDFIRRQLLSARLHHESWPLIALSMLGTALSLTGASVLAVLALASGNWAPALGVAALLAASSVAMASAWIWADRQINRLAYRRGEEAYDFSWKCLLAVPLTLAVHLMCLVSASFLRKVEWRGITYRLYGRKRLQLLEYRPYCVIRSPNSKSSVV